MNTNGEKKPEIPDITEKASREEFINNSGAHLAAAVRNTLTTNFDFGVIAALLAVVLAMLDQQPGESVIDPMKLRMTRKQAERWAIHVLRKLNRFGVGDARLRTSQFWSDLIRKLEVELRGFTKE